MNLKQKGPDFPTEFGVMAGLVIGWSGQFPIAIFALVAWLILRRFRPATPSEILFVTAVILGQTPLALFAVFAGYTPPTTSIEIIVVLGVAILLFATRAQVWAYLLLAHAFYVGISHALTLAYGTYEPGYQRIAGGTIALRILVAWMLICYIRRAPHLIHPETSGPSSNEPGTP